METLQGIFNTAVGSVKGGIALLWGKVTPVLPDVALAVVVLIVGSYLAKLVSDVLTKLVKKANIDPLVGKALAPVSNGNKVVASSIVGVAIKWFLLAAVMIAALNLANLSGVVDFAVGALGYLPNIIVAVFIVVVGSMIAKLAAKLVGFVTHENYLIAGSRLAVNTLALIAALTQLATPLAASLGQFLGGLGMSRLQSDALFIVLLVIAVMAGKSAAIKLVQGLSKG